MPDVIGIYYNASGVETGGTNALTGLITGGTRLSVADAETSPLTFTALDTAHTIYYKAEDSASFDDVGRNTTASFTLIAPTGYSLCSTWNGSFGASAIVAAATGAYQPAYIMQTSAGAGALNLTVAGTGVSPTIGSRVGQVGTVTLTYGNGTITADCDDVASADGYQWDIS